MLPQVTIENVRDVFSGQGVYVSEHFSVMRPVGYRYIQ